MSTWYWPDTLYTSSPLIFTTPPWNGDCCPSFTDKATGIQTGWVIYRKSQSVPKLGLKPESD